MKRPSFQFYPGDWLQDVPLRMVSASARGLWIDMLCLMHQGSEYGYLKVNHEVIQKVNLARLVGLPLDEVITDLAELEKSGIFSRDEKGCIFSRRMIKDEELRQIRAACGKQGGNPKLMQGNKVNPLVAAKVNQKPTPSSSSSSSSSKLKESTKEKASRLSEDFRMPIEWQNWYFKERPNSNLTELAAILNTFKDYWIAKPGKDGTKLNWFSTWRNWVRREKEFSPKKNEKFDPIAYINKGKDEHGNDEKDISSEVVRTD